MDLKVDQLVRPPGERFWYPFEFVEAGNGFTLDWWHHGPVYPGSDSTFLRFLNGDAEVARVHLDDRVGIDHYAGVPPLGDQALEIQFIEVHANFRLIGVGRQVVETLEELYPSRRLVAFSEDADGFWFALGWSRYVHVDPRQAKFYRPLFIEPDRGSSEG